jgi:hypothetical protein
MQPAQPVATRLEREHRRPAPSGLSSHDDVVAGNLDARPRKRLGCHAPIEAFAADLGVALEMRSRPAACRQRFVVPGFRLGESIVGRPLSERRSLRGAPLLVGSIDQQPFVWAALSSPSRPRSRWQKTQLRPRRIKPDQ